MSAEMKAQLQFHFIVTILGHHTVILLFRMFCLRIKQKLLFVYSMQVNHFTFKLNFMNNSS